REAVLHQAVDNDGSIVGIQDSDDHFHKYVPPFVVLTYLCSGSSFGYVPFKENILFCTSILPRNSDFGKVEEKGYS
ncbi:MAG: hypothetical protein IJC44_05195, partial [Clostridia bacterium]|nr:hypothetical protein [Clostridia bacterium]